MTRYLQKGDSFVPRDSKGEARDLRDDGMRRAVEHADDVNDRWQVRAYGFLLEYLARHPGELLTCERARQFAEELGLPTPPDQRAWGKVMVRAASAGAISKAGYEAAANPKGHCRPVTLWKAK